MTTMATKRVSPRIDASQVQDLEHWVSLPEAGEMLGITRQRAYGWAAEGRFSSLRKIRSGKDVPAENRRAVFVVRRSEVEKLVRRRSEAAIAAEAGLTTSDT
jgi:hypothetical protein